jgi:hypothetical protein
MVVYDLQCSAGHALEGWFRGSDDYDAQHARGLLSCPVCQTAEVLRRPTAARIGRGIDVTTPVAAPTTGATIQPPPVAMARALREFVERHFEDVGSRFASEARRIHYGEAEERNIRGAASVDEVRELHDEGIDVRPLPLPDPEKLN